MSWKHWGAFLNWEFGDSIEFRLEQKCSRKKKVRKGNGTDSSKRVMFSLIIWNGKERCFWWISDKICRIDKAIEDFGNMKYF